MAMIKRYAICRSIDGIAEYYDGCETAHYDGFQPDREYVDDFRTYSKAKRRADRVGGQVFMFERPADIADQFVTPMIVPVPALHAGHNTSIRLEYAHLEIVRGATLLEAAE